jgi:hypothetical protein
MFFHQRAYSKRGQAEAVEIYLVAAALVGGNFLSQRVFIHRLISKT